ncbi:MAG: zf-TFIIB domain-containing protein, partial [Candidatus Binatia bacterium]
METEKDRFGEKMKLVERAKEDIYFTAKDRELIEKLKARLRKVERVEPSLACPKCAGKLESYSLHEILLDRCQVCGGIWLDKGELEQILTKVARSPLASLIG